MKNKLFLLLILPAALIAQSGASVSGVVQDPQGRPVPGASLTLFSQTGSAGSATTSNSSGAYRFEGLPAGDYLLRAAAPGFTLYLTGGIHLDAATAAKRTVALEVAGVHEQVVVTASSTPQLPESVSKATTVIDHSDADARDATALGDVVALAPGIRVEQLGGPGAFTSIKIRGLSNEDTALLVDGIRLRDSSATQGDASGFIEDLLLNDTNRVELMRGSGSSLYGTNAIGGVVNVITGEGGGRTRGSILLEGGSLASFRGRAQIEGAFVNDRIQYSLGVSETDVIRGVTGDLPFRNTSTQGRITFHLSPKIRLTARIFGIDSFIKVPGSPDVLGNPSGLGIINANSSNFVPAPDNPDSTRAGRFIDAALILNGQATPSFDYSVSYNLLSSGRRYGDGPAGLDYQPDGSTRSLYDGRINTVNAQFHYRAGHYNLLSGGYEFENENYAYDSTDQSDPLAASAVNVSERSHSVYAQDQLQFLNGRLQISGGFRAQFFSLDTPAFLPVAYEPYQGIAFPSPTPAYTGDGSASYFFRKSGTKLRAHVGRGYRAPSLFERFGAGFDPIFGYSVYGDPRLSPEHSIGLDAGFDQMFWQGRVKASGSYFYTWLQNVIGFDTVNMATDQFGRFAGYLNTRGGISRGFETSAAVAATRSLKVTAAYTYVNAIERSPIVGNVLQTFVIPRNQFSLLVTEQPTSRLLFTFDTVASSSYLAPLYSYVVTQAYRFSGPHKVNAGASYRIPLKEYKAIRFFVRAQNLFNQTYYESGYLTPGRIASGGVQYEF